MFSAMWVLAVGLAAVCIVGAPVAFFGCNPKTVDNELQKRGTAFSIDAVWCLVPFVGYAVIYTVLQFFVAMNIPVKHVAWPFLFVFACVFSFCVYQCMHAKRRLRYLPSQQFLLGLALTLAVAGLGYFVVGAQFYKGYSWTDIFFYGIHAEAIRDVPLNLVQELRIQGKEWLYYFISNRELYHRMAIGIVQAFVAHIAMVDGASVIGFMSLLSTVLVYCATHLFAESFVKNKWQLMLVSMATALMPAVISTQLEGFLGASISVGFMMLLCVLLPKMLEQGSWKLTALVALLASASFSSFTTGILLSGAVFIVTIIVFVITRKIPIKNYLQVFGLGAFFVMCNFPFLKSNISEALVTGQAPTLNFIYDFADKPQLYPWVFFGTDFNSVLFGIETSTLFILLQKATTLLGILLFAIGLLGLVFAFFQYRSVTIINAVALFGGSLYFLLDTQPQQYSFYKMASYFFPFLMLGILLFAIKCKEELQLHFWKDKISKKEIKVRTAVARLPMVIVLCVFALCTAGSLRLVWRATTSENYYYHDDGYRILYTRLNQNENNSPQNQAIYQQLQDLEGENILLIAGPGDFGYWWMTYYGRNNTLYLLPEQADDIFSGPANGQDMGKNIPDDCRVFVDPTMQNLFVLEDGTAAGNDTVALIASKGEGDSCYFTGANHTVGAEEFSVYAYTKQKTTVKASTQAYWSDVSRDTIDITVQDKTYSVQNGEAFEFGIDFKKGAQIVEIHASESCGLSQITFQLS